MEPHIFTDFLLFLLLLIALAAGWHLGRRSTGLQLHMAGKRGQSAPDKDYFVGLNYLLNDEPDDAIDIFTDFLEINAKTLDTYIALGKLLRRRGKVDQSITIYQELLGKGIFGESAIHEIKLNLVQSYIAAGLLDRAEFILDEFKKSTGAVKSRALEYAISLAQQEKEWEKGIAAILDLIRIISGERRESLQLQASHFYCELALSDMARGHAARARTNLKLASDMDRMNPRVSMLRGELEMQYGNDREAIKYLLRVNKQDSLFLAEVFPRLVDCYRKAGKEKALRKFVEECMETNSSTSVVLGISMFLRQERGLDAAREYLEHKLGAKSSLRLLYSLLKLDDDTLSTDHGHRGQVLELLGEYLETQPQYQCHNCGFELKTLHWLCPSCAEWGTVRHLTGILGE